MLFILIIEYQNKKHAFNWLNTLHVTFTILRYRLGCWYRLVQKPCIDWCCWSYTWFLDRSTSHGPWNRYFPHLRLGQYHFHWSVPWPLGSLYILILPSISVTIIHLLTGYESNSTFIVPKVPTIFQGNTEENSWYRGDN